MNFYDSYFSWRLLFYVILLNPSDFKHVELGFALGCLCTAAWAGRWGRWIRSSDHTGTDCRVARPAVDVALSGPLGAPWGPLGGPWEPLVERKKPAGVASAPVKPEVASKFMRALRDQYLQGQRLSLSQSKHVKTTYFCGCARNFQESRGEKDVQQVLL